MKTARIERAFNKVRDELQSLGLIYEGVYLDKVELVVSPLPIWAVGAYGFVYDEGVPFLGRLVGFEEGKIYIPGVMENEPDILTDVIRHEFAHAWACLDKKFMRGRWFKEAFGKPYFSEWRAVEGVSEFEFSSEYLDYASDYALTRPAEDFAETFQLYLKHRNNLKRFNRRPGLRRKLRALHNAIGTKAAEL